MAKAKASALSDEESDRLRRAATSARESNGTDSFMDATNRTWFVGTMNVENHSHVLIQVHRGEPLRERYLRTDTFNPDLVSQAIAELDGELP
jgi:hypothetical protein